MPDAACFTTNSPLSTPVASDEISTNNPRGLNMDSSTEIDLVPTLAAVAADPAMSQITSRLVTCCNTKVQTPPPPDAAAFEQTYGRPAQMSDLEHRVGLAGNGRYSAPDDELHGAKVGCTFIHSLPMPDAKPTYVESGFQVMPYEPLQRALVKAKFKASKTASTFKKLAAQDGYIIWAESRNQMVVHSEQFSFHIELDDKGNAPAGANLTGHYLRNIYKENIVTKNETGAADTAAKAGSPAFSQPIIIIPTQRDSSAAQGTPSPPRPIPALGPAMPPLMEDRPEYKAPKDTVAQDKKSSIQMSSAEEALSKRLPGEESPSAQPLVEYASEYFQPQEYGDVGDHEEVSDAYENFTTFIVYDSELPERSHAPPTSKTEEEPLLLASRKRKVLHRADDAKNSECGNGSHKRVQIIDFRNRNAQSSTPNFVKQEPAFHRLDSDNSDHLSHTREMLLAKSSEHDPKVSRKFNSRSSHAEARQRSRSPSRDAYSYHTSTASTDRRQSNRYRQRSRSPKRSDHEITKAERDRKELSSDRRRDKRTIRELDREAHDPTTGCSLGDMTAAVAINEPFDCEKNAAIDLSQAAIPTPPESNKSTPPRTTSNIEDTKSTRPTKQSKAAKSDFSSSEIKSVDQPGRKPSKRLASRREGDSTVDAIIPATKDETNTVNDTDGNKELPSHSQFVQKKHMSCSRNGTKRSRDEDDEEAQVDRSKRPKNEVKKTVYRGEQNDTLHINDDDSSKDDARGHIQHTSARTATNKNEAANTASKPSKEDIEKKKVLDEGEQKKREIKAKIAERHAKRAPRARVGAEMERWIPRQMRQDAQNGGSDANQRRGERNRRPEWRR